MIPLPLPHQHKRDRGDRYCPATPAFYTSDQMLSYGEACRKDERERCEKVCLKVSHELQAMGCKTPGDEVDIASMLAYMIRECTP